MENAIVAGLCSSSHCQGNGGGPAKCHEEEHQEKMLLRHKRHTAPYNSVPDSYKKNIEKGNNNGRWSFEEHKKFILAILEHGNKWKEVEKLIGTRNSAQIRSHSQKFFTKLSKLGLEGKYSKIADSRYMHDLALTMEKEELTQLIIQLTDVAYHRMENSDWHNEDHTCNSRKSLGISSIENESMSSLKVQIPLSFDNYDEKTNTSTKPVNELSKIITSNSNLLEKKIGNIKSNYNNIPLSRLSLENKKSEKGESKTSISSFANPCPNTNTDRESLQQLKILTDPYSSFHGIDEEILFAENEYSFDLVECEREKFKNSVLNISHIAEPKNEVNFFDETSINCDKLFNEEFNYLGELNKKKDVYYEMMRNKVSNYTKGNCELTESLHLENHCDMEETFKQIEDEVYLTNFNPKMDII